MIARPRLILRHLDELSPEWRSTLLHLVGDTPHRSIELWVQPSDVLVSVEIA